MVEQPSLFERPFTWATVREPLAAVWRFLRHEILFILWALMEVSLLAPLFLAAMPWARFWPPDIFALWVLLLMLVPFNLIRVMSLVDIPQDRQRLVLVGGLFVIILLSLRTLLYEPTSLVDLGWIGEFFAHTGQPDNPLWSRDVIIFIAICFSWWRGISLAGRSVDIGDIGVRFRVVSLFLAVLVGGIAQSLLTQPVTPFILLFFLSSLMAIVLTRIEQLEMNQSGRSFPLGPRWVVIVGLAALLVVFMIGILAAVAGGTAVDQIVGWLAPFWKAIEFLATSVVIMFSYLSVPIILALQWIMGLVASLVGPINLGNVDLSFLEPIFNPETVEKLNKEGNPTSPLPLQLITVLSMIFFVLLISLAYGRLRRFLRLFSEADTELVNPLENLSGKRPGIGHRLLNRLGLFRRWQAAASIRRIYRDMCRMAGSSGFPRLESETPYEYLKTLKDAWPENTADTLLITEAYNRVRYGELPETQAELDEIEEAWKRLERILPDGEQPKDELQIHTLKDK